MCKYRRFGSAFAVGPPIGGLSLSAGGLSLSAGGLSPVMAHGLSQVMTSGSGAGWCPAVTCADTPEITAPGIRVVIVLLAVLLYTLFVALASCWCCWAKRHTSPTSDAATSTEEDGNTAGKIFVSSGGLRYHHNRDCGAILNSSVVAKRPCLKCTRS